MKNGLCLAGGGVKGAAHIGVIKALEEENIEFDYIGGTSSGSIVASLYSCGYTADEIYSIFKKYCKKIRYVDFFNIIKLILGLLFTRRIVIDGLNSGKQIEKLINKMCSLRNVYNIKDITKNLVIPSVNLCNGEVICFTSVDNKIDNIENTIFLNDIEIGRAVRASCSYPIIFSPCSYKKIKLIDGGIRENVPWRELKKIGAERILNVVFEEDTNVFCNKNLVEVASSSIEYLCKELAEYELNGAGITLRIKSKKVGLLDIREIDKLYKLGYDTTKKNINKIKKIYKNHT